MKNLGALKTAGSKLFSSPVLAEKNLAAVGLEKKFGAGKNVMGVSSGSKHTVLLQVKPPGEEHHW